MTRFDPVGVALDDLDSLQRHIEILRNHLGIGGFMPLAVRLCADQYREITVLLKLHRAFFTVPPSRAFDVTGDAESAYGAALERVFVTAVAFGMIGFGEGSAQCGFGSHHDGN